jgi:hypothetical protein
MKLISYVFAALCSLSLAALAEGGGAGSTGGTHVVPAASAAEGGGGGSTGGTHLAVGGRVDGPRSSESASAGANYRPVRKAASAVHAASAK